MQYIEPGKWLHAILFAITALALGAALIPSGTQAGADQCGEPSTCPAPDADQPPQVSCHTPTSHTIDENPTLHIYGKHLVRDDQPPEQVIYRNASASGTAGRTNDEIEVKTPCHVTVELFVAASPSLTAGSTVEFRLQRDPADKDMVESEDYSAVATDWHEVKMTD